MTGSWSAWLKDTLALSRQRNKDVKIAAVLKNLTSSRTIISISVSAALKILVAKRVLGADSLEQVEDITTFILMFSSVVADGLGIFFRLKATAPGALTPQYEAHEAWLKNGEDRRIIGSVDTEQIAGQVAEDLKDRTAERKVEQAASDKQAERAETRKAERRAEEAAETKKK